MLGIKAQHRRLTLLMPRLLPQAPSLPRFPAIETLLARGRREHIAAHGLEATLCALCGVQAAADADLPLAAIARRGEGAQADGDVWLRADPVHLRADLDHLLLYPLPPQAINADDAESLRTDVARAFSDQGWCLEAAAPDRWYLRVAHAPAIRTHALSEVAGRNILRFLPEGGDAPAWRGYLNEIQMLLHAHPVNQARDAAGLPTVNSLWFWGVGRLPRQLTPRFDSVWADNVTARGLACLADAGNRSLPTSAEQWQVSAGAGEHLVVIDNDEITPGLRDLDDYISLLEWVEEHWIVALLRAVHRGRLHTLTLCFDDGRCWHTRQRDLWRVWRRPRALTDYG